MSYSSEVLADSPSFFLPFDEASISAADAAGGPNWPWGAGTVAGLSPLLSDGGKAVSGGGTSVIASTPSVPAGLGGANVTASAWVNIPATGVQGTFVKIGNNATGWGFGIGSSQLDNSGSRLILLAENVAWVPTTYLFPGAGTYHVMVVRGSGTATAFINGVQVWTGSFSPNTGTSEMAVGGRSGGLLLSSSVKVDNVAIFPSALSAARAAAHYNSGAGDNAALAADGPAVWLKFDEASSYGTADLAGAGGWTYTTTATVGQPGIVADGGYSASGGRIASRSGVPSGVAPVRGTSLEAWVNLPTSSLHGTFVMIGGSTSGWAIGVGANQLDNNGNNLVATLSNVSWNPSGASIGTGSHHIVVTLDSAGMMRFYVDGAQVASQSTSAPVAASGSCSVGGRAPGDGVTAYDLSSTVRVDAVAAYPTVLSAARIAAHYVAGTSSGPATVTGSVAATASAPSVSASGVVPAQGQVSASASAPTVAVSGTAFSLTTGSVSAAASAPAVSVSGNVAGVTSGVVAATASAPSVAVDGVVPTPVTGDVSASAPHPSVTVTDSTVGASIAVGVTVEVGALTLLNLVALPGVEVEVGAGLEVGDSLPVVPLPGVNVAVGLSLDARPVELVAADPRHKRTQWRYVVTDLANKPLGELVDIQHDPVADGVNTPTTMRFTMASDDPARALVEAGGSLTRKCQVWAGNQLLLWGPILPDQQSDNGTAGYTVHDPSWWWRGGRRVIGRLPRKNLLRNGDFKNGLTYWTRGFDADSKPKAAPKVRVVSEDFLEDTDGLDPIRAAEITGVESFTESELSSNAVFWPNLATFRPGGKAAIEAVANAMPSTAGLKVTVIGHTANDGTGNGLRLSKRRADAAAAIIHAKRPGAVITTKGVGYYDPKPGFPIGSQEQRRVVIQYDQTISGESKQWIKQTIEVTQPKSARYPLDLTLAAMLKVADDWSVPDANMVSLKVVVRRKGAAKPLPWDEQLGQGESSISDTDPVDRWIGQSASATVPADGRAYLVDAYLYAPAALARYTAVGLFPEEELYFWGVDQALIFKGIAEHIQDTAMGHGDLGIETRTPLTGIKRDRTYPFRDHMPADTALEEFAGLNRGMDYDTLMLADGRVILSTFYPQQGKHTPYVLVQGGNVANASPERSRDVASSIIMQAQDLGAYRAEAYAKDTRALGGLLLERVVTAEQETPLNELREAARQELAWGRVSTTGYWVDIDPESIDEVLASTGKGDVVRLILDSPDRVDALARIVSRERHPDSLRLLVTLDQEA